MADRSRSKGEKLKGRVKSVVVVGEEELEGSSGKAVHNLCVKVSDADLAFIRDLSLRTNRTQKDLILEALRNLRQSEFPVDRLLDIVRAAIDAAFNGGSKDSVCGRSELSDVERSVCVSVFDGVQSNLGVLRLRFSNERADLEKRFEAERSELVKRFEREKAAAYEAGVRDIMNRVEKVLDRVADYVAFHRSVKACESLDDDVERTLCVGLYRALSAIDAKRDLWTWLRLSRFIES